MKPERERILLVLWVSGRCNLRCEYCYADGNPSKKDMDREVMLKTLDFFQNYPLKVQFAGGEPMMNFPLIRETCERARSMEMDVSFQMQTNASLSGERQASEIRRLNIAVGVSLDGIPQVNEKVRGKTAQVIRGIQALKAAGVCVNINSVVTARNVERLPELVDFALYLGNVGGIGLDLLRCSGRGISSYRELQVSGRSVQEALEGMYRRSEELYRLTGKRIALREVEEAVMRLKALENPRGYCCLLYTSRILIVLISSILTAMVTAFAGPISFGGLAVPHIVRMVFKTSNNRIILPAVCICGALMTSLCDLGTRMIMNPVELPLSCMTSIIGAPLVVFLLLKQKGNEL